MGEITLASIISDASSMITFMTTTLTSLVSIWPVLIPLILGIAGWGIGKARGLLRLGGGKRKRS